MPDTKNEIVLNCGIEGQLDLMVNYAMMLGNVYDELFELNLTHNTYRVLFHTKEKYLMPALSGPLDSMLAQVADVMLHPDDKQRFLLFCANELPLILEDETGRAEIEYRKRLLNGGYCWVRVTVLSVPKAAESIVLCYIMNIEKQRQLEEKTALLQELCKVAVASEYSSVLLIDVLQGQYTDYNFSQDVAVASCSGLYEDFVRQKAALVIAEDRPLFERRMAMPAVLNALENGGLQEVRVRELSSGEPRYVVTRIVRFRQRNDMLLCTTRDVHDAWVAELKTQDLLMRTVESIGAIYRNILEIFPRDDRVHVIKSRRFPHLEKKLYDAEMLRNNFFPTFFPDDRDKVSRHFSQRGLLDFIERGEKYKKMEMRASTDNGGYEWVEISLFAVPSRSDGMERILMTSRSVDDAHTLKGIVDRFVFRVCDYFALLDLRRNSYTMFTHQEGTDLIPPTRSDDYEGTMKSYVCAHVLPEDRERVLAAISLSNVHSYMEKHDEYILYYSIRQGDRIARKKLYFTCHDAVNGTVLVTRTDITDVYNEEQRKSDLLRQALAVAEAASKAKTDFLSRMSHDIRTPLNAIMGMTAIARTQKVLPYPEKIDDCLQKIETSSTFLLSLINDVLDMSRIESGQIRLSMKEFDLQRLLSEIMTIIQPQAESRDITFVVQLEANARRRYKGDMLRLNQIVMNLVSNSLKHTPAGGEVRLIVQDGEQWEQGMHLRFCISDTGCGMSQEFQKRMFEPFEQENSGFARNQVGTGLGLAIVYSLVRLMQGTLEVSSVLGKGTSISFDVPLDFVQGQVLERERGALGRRDVYRALVVDSASTGDNLKTLLAAGGVSCMSVASCAQAVETLRAQWPDISYDAVFVDAAVLAAEESAVCQSLQALCRRNTAFVLTGMTGDAPEVMADLEARTGFAWCACMGVVSSYEAYKGHLVLAPVLRKVREWRAALRSQNKNLPYAGMRILALEDNDVNMEIIRTLLEELGIQVDPAVNGREGLDMFAAKDPKYYDAVFVDIRMPVMDGNAAVRAMRDLENKLQRPVPMVAMSANAFQEDKKLASDAGINHYLIKPLDVNALHAILDRIL